jgi:hypothetical protein
VVLQIECYFAGLSNCNDNKKVHQSKADFHQTKRAGNFNVIKSDKKLGVKKIQ